MSFHTHFLLNVIIIYLPGLPVLICQDFLDSSNHLYCPSRPLPLVQSPSRTAPSKLSALMSANCSASSLSSPVKPLNGSASSSESSPSSKWSSVPSRLILAILAKYWYHTFYLRYEKLQHLKFHMAFQTGLQHLNNVPHCLNDLMIMASVMAFHAFLIHLINVGYT